MKTLLLKNRLTSIPALIVLLLASYAVQAQSLPDFTALVESNSPSVVNISTKQHKSVPSRLNREFQMPELPEGSPFNEFFRHFFGEGGPGESEPREYDARSLGSGFIISDDGYIMTNFHVVKGADEILVRLSDRREYLAKVIGMDKTSDVALLKIDAKDLPQVKIGTTSNLKVGEWVLAIGSPFGFDHSVTAGIVSAKGRSLPNENYVPFIQTDVAINPGNSGGPLFNLEGEVVGINSQIYSRTGGFMGLSFAIPIELAMNVVDQLRTSGEVKRGWLGVMIQDVTRELAESFGMEYPYGALIARVVPGSPSEEAGLEVGDVILKYNGTKLESSSMLQHLVGASRIDKPAELEILRNGVRKTIKVNIGELKNDMAQGGMEGSMQQSYSSLGMSVVELDSDIRSQYKLNGIKGVFVQSVDDGAAKRAGIEPGDVIQMINRVRVSTVKEFDEAVENLPKGATIAVLIHRRNGARFIPLQVPNE
ncbi:DegQ family serine endoprotease [Sedimenticola sp.]|uniref:DegQ family serine endoprotease n=1 Tax=Sedimenticola sp. TaxID=1940285 RepID=UPI00258A6EC6|nr:DegQ family serine endoprotease [Sedimenticola sp.]MCW8902187.1 DegQ family serine endoprotease [Sedimenticola sp.]